MRTKVFPGNYESLSIIAEFVRQAAEEVGLDPCATYAVETAVDEACSNIIEHAYGGENIGDIVCTCFIKSSELVIQLQDTGRSFNPDLVEDPDITAPLEERENHGLGLYMMRQWMDEVRFSFDDGINTLTMVKRKETVC
ncbi:MAG TPA: ATP-binding protein [Chloroflexi bacterium]|jgi:serine/threonine-protein kinase RsbW|nr:ATP-binding protein [Chloroflexota bacterium]HPO59107.1 ATP-binding protein [Anaerolineaceae bacterium]